MLVGHGTGGLFDGERAEAPPQEGDGQAARPPRLRPVSNPGAGLAPLCPCKDPTQLDPAASPRLNDAVNGIEGQARKG